MSDDSLSFMDDWLAPPKPKGTFWCECGRFARFVRERHYFNGEFDCYSYTVDCSRCGIVTVECV